VAVGLLAGALAMSGFALAPSAGATTSVTTKRLAGTNRYGTAAAIAGDATFAAPTTAIVATGENFPDALAASSLAGANSPAPIVLTQTSTYTGDAKTALAALKGKGITAVTIVGGTAAVAQSVEDAIKADGFTTTRQAGADRYATAAAIATAANAKSPAAAIGGFKTALIATGTNFPDALAGGPAAYANKLPLLLVNDTVPQATKDALTTLNIKKAVILGGTAAVSDAVKTQLDALTGNPSDRLADIDRYGTAAKIGDYEITTLGFPAASAVAATGKNFPDALAAGPLGGQNKAPIVLTASCPAPTTAFLDAHSATIANIFIAGGTSAVDDATVTCLTDAAKKVDNDTGVNQTGTTRPELVSAKVVKTVSTTAGTAADPAGTTVAFTFDEPVTGAATVFGSFHAYRYSAPGTQISATASAVSATDSKTVNALFGTLTTTDNNATTGTAGITVATVDLGAVTGSGGTADTNPEGAAALTTNGSAAVTAGSTSAPDLLSIGRFGLPAPLATQTKREVDFTFDQAAYVQGTTGFHVVTTDRVVVDCVPPAVGSTNTAFPGGGNAAGGNGTTVITVECPAIGSGAFSGQPVSATNIARGFDDASTVGTGAPPASATNSVNAPQVADSPKIATNGPDLTAVTFTPGTGVQTVDTAVFTFDEAVTSTLSAASFHAYQSDGTLLTGSGTPLRNGDATQVSVDFTLGSLSSAVGGYIAAGGVTAAAGANNVNAFDEISSVASGTTVTPGTTAGPDLTGVLVVKTNNAFGDLASASVLYVFDSSITAGATASKYFLHLSDGARMVCNVILTTAASSAIPANSALCSTAAGGFTFVDGSPDQSGTNTGVATAAQVASGILGSVDNGAATDSSARPNPEGAKVTAGGNGTPAS
jgi:putative cell wall-binding protein